MRHTRPCEVCSATYIPSYRDQRTCGRACGVILRRWNDTLAAPHTPVTWRQSWVAATRARRVIV